jgi:hypothetical protein
MAVVTFEIVTGLQTLIRRDFPLADRTLANPTAATVLYEGEFVKFNTSYQVLRAADNEFGLAVFVEKGRMDVQALGKVTVLMGNTYEADTRIFTSAALALGGALSIADNVSYDGKTLSGLAVYASGPVIGYVTRLPANNGGKLRFIQTLV